MTPEEKTAVQRLVLVCAGLNQRLHNMALGQLKQRGVKHTKNFDKLFAETNEMLDGIAGLLLS